MESLMQLSIFPFIEALDSESILFLQNHIKFISIPKNNILFYQGDVCKNIMWLTKGEVRLYTQSGDTEELTLYILKAGEQCIVNTASIFSKTGAIASAQSITDIEGYVIDDDSVKKFSKMSDVYQSYLFSIYQLRFETLACLINDIKFKHLDVRILEWLQKQENNIIEITHEHIGIELGSSRVVVSRVLKELENKGYIILHRGKIEIL
jgi:CRP/FNR family transcriptional regulator